MPDGSFVLSADTDALDPVEFARIALHHADIDLYAGGIDLAMISRAFAQVKSHLRAAGRRAGGSFKLIYDQSDEPPALHSIHFEYRATDNRRRFDCVGFSADIANLLTMADTFSRSVERRREKTGVDIESAVIAAIRAIS
jgi:hypothetical protein